MRKRKTSSLRIRSKRGRNSKSIAGGERTDLLDALERNQERNDS